MLMPLAWLFVKPRLPALTVAANLPLTMLVLVRSAPVFVSTAKSVVVTILAELLVSSLTAPFTDFNVTLLLEAVVMPLLL